MNEKYKKYITKFLVISLLIIYFVVLPLISTNSSNQSNDNKKRSLLVDPKTYSTKSVSENFLENPLTYFIMIWMIVHVLLGILFFCFLASERALMKPTSVTL
ncbi:putative transmembrane protein [Cryptosporidium ryanae]|uniref:putative transmembrane protein n=1 Tax=Cryptosporidium ryanae TaxID=515981 RepID=UPI00351AA1C9|nr:putative transmembrane protein [Cryptosporidium ryanae]